ncbi:MAG: cyclic nucleotide-binding domain-containing protein [Anaerolineae bacterium]|nr:cyclic nucleotide-binding domain-containing protein [Anaerolineae bacterium]
MPDRFILSSVKRLPMFAQLTPQQIERIADAMQILRLDPGEEVFRQGEPKPGLMLFVSGRGALTQRGADGVERPFGVVGPNEYLNQETLLRDEIAPATLRTVETTIILFLSRQQIRSLMAYNPDIRDALRGPSRPSKPIPAATAGSGSFSGLRENEKVLMEIRKHWWVLVRYIGTTLLLIIALWVLTALLGRSAPAFPWLLVALPGTLALAAWVAYAYIEWANDVAIITDRRLINIHVQILAFRRSVNEIPLDSIHEITTELPPLRDFVGRMLGYGTVVIKTSGEADTVRLEEIPRPQIVQETVFNRRRLYQEQQQNEQRSAARSAIRGEINKFLGEDGTQQNQDSGPQSSAPRRTDGGLFALRYTNEDGETVYRKHHFVWFTHVTLPGILIMASVILLLLGVIGALIPLLLMTIGAIWFYLADWDWRNDLYIIGDKTITLIHRRPLWLQDQKDQVLLSQVDNVLANTQGLLNSLLKIGQVRVLLTGADNNPKVFNWVYEPQKIQEEISRRQERAEQTRKQAEAEQYRQSIVEYLSVYHETLQGGNVPSGAQGLPSAPPSAYSNLPSAPRPQTPSQVRDRSRPPGIPRARRGNPPTSGL